jgi:sortase A
MGTTANRLGHGPARRAGATAAGAARPRRAALVRPALPAVRAILLVAGACLLLWTLVGWRWQEPITALYARHEQRSLAAAYERAEARWQERARARAPATRAELAAVARRYRRGLDEGDAVGRLGITRLGLDLVVGNGTDPATLRSGPGRDLRSFVPGAGELVYLAGHRTTYLAPFSRLDVLRPGDRITFALPYATFRYSVTHHVVVADTDLSVLRSPGRETLALQTCHPRFFASERYVVYARLVSVRARPPSGRTLPRAGRKRQRGR